MTPVAVRCMALLIVYRQLFRIRKKKKHLYCSLCDKYELFAVLSPDESLQRIQR